MTIIHTTASRRLRRGLLIATLATCAVPAAASASTLDARGDTLLHRGGGERNIVSVREEAGTLIVFDSAGLTEVGDVFTPRRFCGRIDTKTLRCPIKPYKALLGDGDDTAGPFNTSVRVVVDGQNNNDTFIAGNPSFLTKVEFRGGGNSGTFGGGNDRANYAGSGQGAGGRGVRVSNDGVANDGRPGLDADNIGTDVEELVGSRFADELTAAADGSRLCCSMDLVGGQGDDVLRAGTGSFFAVFKMGATVDGADKLVGGQRKSIVDYGERTRPVNVTPNFGGADDGEAGERDEVIGGQDTVTGGEGADTLFAPLGSKAPHRIFGGGGNDRIDGADGPDFLSGGSGGDTVRGFGSDDRVLAKDGLADTADCGSGSDTVEADGIDDLDNCESGTIGVLRLAPKVLRAKAGKPSRMTLSWRHPRSWKRLRGITLRLHDGGVSVGEVGISPRTRRVRGGGQVSVVRRSTRIARRGKTASARLALRLDGRLSGRKLRLEVEAVDVRGARQLVHRAGSIRVVR